jgi:sugar lactone lactonase YvrE
MKKIILSLTLIAFFILALAPLAGGLYAQSGTIAPNYITVPSIAALPTCAVPDKGKTVFNSGDNKMYYCDGTAWQAMSGGVGGGALSLTTNNIANSTSGNFGIGTNTPSNKLEINSGVPNKTGLKFTTMTSAAGPLAASTKFVNSANTRGLAIDNAGNIFATEQSTNKIIKITPAGAITTLVSSGLSTPWDITFGPDSNLYVCNYGANTVSKVITTTGIVSTYAAGFTNPTGLCFDNTGNMFVVNAGNGNLSKVTPLAASVTFAFGTGINQGSGCVFSPMTNKIYIGGNISNEVSQIDASTGGAKTTFVSGYTAPSGINIDALGNLYVSLAGLFKIIKITPATVVTDLFLSFTPTDIVFDTKNNFYVGNVFGGSIDTYTETYPNVLSLNPAGEVVKINKPEDLWVKDGTSIRNTNTDGIWSSNIIGLNNSSNDVSNPPTAPINGAGTRLMWIPKRSAFRVGTVTGNEWNADSVGLFSSVLGNNSKAIGINSMSLGLGNRSNGIASFTFGVGCKANGVNSSMAIGYSAISSGFHSISIGDGANSIGPSTIALGFGAIASTQYSVSIGKTTSSYGIASLSTGENTVSYGQASTAMGLGTIASPIASTAIGSFNTDNPNGLFMVGNGGTNLTRKTVFIIRNDNNRVGIGIEDPLAPLHITNVTNQLSGGNGQSFFPGINGAFSTADFIGRSISILTEGGIYSKNSVGSYQSITSSDSRLKKDLSITSNSEDLERLRKIEITNYRMKDVATWGTQTFKKVIAQQVEEVYPEVINKTKSVIPDIYALAESVAYDAVTKNLSVTLSKEYNIKLGEKIELVHPEKGNILAEVIAVSGKNFTVKSWEYATEKIFVFGREVNDFRSVDYEALSMLGISSIQALAKENEKKSITIDELRITISKQEARLEAIENLLKSNLPTGK